MTNDRLQAFLARRGAAASPDLIRLREADEILRWVLAGDGPVALADRSAWEIVSSECRCVEIQGTLWWEQQAVHADLIDLLMDEDEAARLEEVQHAQRYLVARQLLEQHPCHQRLVRLRA